MQQKCIKCRALYETNDPDPYYCSQCLPQVKEAAKQVDEKISKIQRKPVKSGLQQYDEACNGRPFPKAGDLGIKL